MEIGNNLKILRKRLKKSQEEVAQDLNLTRSTYSGYENGVAQPNLENLIAFSDYYKVQIDDLVRKDFDKFSENELERLDKGLYADVKGQKLRVLTSLVNDQEEELIEMVSLKASAGYTSGYADPDYLKVLPTFHLPFLSKNLNAKGIRAKELISGMSYRELDIALDNARFGGFDFLYTSPERLKSKLFIELIFY